MPWSAVVGQFELGVIESASYGRQPGLTWRDTGLLVVVYVSNRFSPVRRSVTRLIPLLLVLLVIAGIVGMVLAA